MEAQTPGLLLNPGKFSTTAEKKQGRISFIPAETNRP
jgi:hypothetical protein